MNSPTKTISIRLPLMLWRSATIAKAEGKIRSLQEAIVEALEEYLERKEKKQ